MGNEKSILVIDSDVDNRRTVRTILESYDFRVLEAGDGDEGLALYDEWQPSLVLSDLILPGKGGLQVMLTIRAKYPDARIIGMNGLFEVGDEMFASFLERLGKSDVLRKPIEKESLTELIGKYFHTDADERKRTILIVEDDNGLRRILQQILERQGFTVLSAENGEQALEICGTSEVSLVLTDILMPKMDGVELIEQLRKHSPGVKLIAMSGIRSAEESFNRNGDEMKDVPFLQKPFSRSQIVAAVEDKLATSEK